MQNTRKQKFLTLTLRLIQYLCKAMKRIIIFGLLTSLLCYSIKAQTIDDLSFGTEETLDIATWNIEFFPKAGTVTIDLVKQIFENTEMDLWALQEIDDPFTLQLITDNIDGYNTTWENLTFEGLSYVYNEETIDITDTYAIFNDSEFSREFPRVPDVMEFTHLGEEYVVINNHLKCCGDGFWEQGDPWDEESRRYDAMSLLKQYIEAFFADKKVILLGDLNDLLTDNFENNIFQLFLYDTSYLASDIEIAEGPSSNWSFPNWPSHLDHIIINDELFSAFEGPNGFIETIKIDEYLPGGFSEFDSKISDHRPVAMRLDALSTLGVSAITTSEVNIMVYPNPAQDVVSITLPNGLTAERIQLYSSDGQLVEQVPANAFSATTVISTEGLAQGVYLLQVFDGSTTYSIKKLVVMR